MKLRQPKFYTDGIHVITDSPAIGDLHGFMAKVGIKRCWFENKRGKNHPHYDLPKSLRNNVGIALLHKHGAKKVSPQVMTRILNDNLQLREDFERMSRNSSWGPF